jgi:hypothetical protein
MEKICEKAVDLHMQKIKEIVSAKAYKNDFDDFESSKDNYVSTTNHELLSSDDDDDDDE